MRAYKIAFVLDDTLDSTDGVQQYVLYVGRRLVTLGHDVHYIVGETKRTDIPNIHSPGRNLKVRFNQNRMSMPLPSSKRKLRGLLQREKFDIIHVQMPYSPFLAGRVLQAIGSQTAAIGTFHIAPHSRLVYVANVLLRIMVRRSLPRFDEVISVSETAQTFAKQTFKIDSVIIPNTIAVAPFREATPIEAYKSTTNIIFFGRLVERKGCQYFLQAINRLRQSNGLPSDCKVLICGKGPMEGSLKAYVARHHLGDTVVFTGFVSEEDKPRYLACGDIIVYPSTGGESFGIVLLEGMAAGRGVVLAGDNPGYAGVLGARPDFLFDPTDESGFADKLSTYLGDPAIRQRASVWQRTYVEQFDVPAVTATITAVYAAALHKRRS